MTIPSTPTTTPAITSAPTTGTSEPQTKFGLGRHHYPSAPDQFGFNSEHRHTGRPGYSTGERVSAGVKEALKPSALIKGAIKSTLFTLPFMLLPGSQLILVPILMGIGAARRFMKAFRHPAKFE